MSNASSPTTVQSQPSPTSTEQALAIISASLAAVKQQEEALASASASAVGKDISSTPTSYKIIGIVLALVSGLFIGSSFVFKKKGLLNSQQAVLDKGGEVGQGHAYLKSPMWWTGMTLMILGEICNFVAYAFADAILVTPMGALSVVICAVLSSIFLKERLSFFGKIGCFLCIIGATTIALNAPQEQAVSTVNEFQKLFLAPGFLVFASVIILAAIGLIFFVAPKHGKTNMMVYIGVCSIIGGLSVVCTQGLGASIITTIKGDNQFKYWFMYFLIAFVVCTLLTEINYLNKALGLFNTAMVTPTYYVMFTFSTLLTSIILFQGLKAPVTDIITLVLGFLVICSGITLLQMSKMDPKDLPIDSKSTVFLSADKEVDDESGLAAEEPGVDGLRGFGGLVGSIHRNSLIARRSTASSLVVMHDRNIARRRRPENTSVGTSIGSEASRVPAGLSRHNLWDRPINEVPYARPFAPRETGPSGEDVRLTVLDKHQDSSLNAPVVPPLGTFPNKSKAHNLALQPRSHPSNSQSSAYPPFDGTVDQAASQYDTSHYQDPYELRSPYRMEEHGWIVTEPSREDESLRRLGTRLRNFPKTMSGSSLPASEMSSQMIRTRGRSTGELSDEPAALSGRQLSQQYSKNATSARAPQAVGLGEDQGTVRPYRKPSKDRHHHLESLAHPTTVTMPAVMKMRHGRKNRKGSVPKLKCSGGEMESLVQSQSPSSSSSFSSSSEGSSSDERQRQPSHPYSIPMNQPTSRIQASFLTMEKPVRRRSVEENITSEASVLSSDRQDLVDGNDILDDAEISKLAPLISHD